MNNLAHKILHHKRLLFSVALLLAASGVVSWLTMPRQEDPRLANRYAMITATFPGADALTIERLIVDPIEEQLAEVAGIKHVITEARADVAVINVGLRDEVSDTRPVWDEVRRALRRAQAELPEGVPPPLLDDDIMDAASVVLAISGLTDPLALHDASRELRRELLQVPGVSRVITLGNPDEQVVVEYDDAVARRLGVDARRLAQVLSGRNSVIPGGSIALGDRLAPLRPMTEFRTLEELARTPIPLPSGAAVPLSQLARIRRAPAEPPQPRMRHDGAMAVGLGVVPREDIDLVAFGAALRQRTERLRARHPALRIQEMSFQPRRVEARLSSLQGSLLMGMGVLAAVLVLAMGIRLGVVVALVVPLVALASLAVYALGGGVLHQISIAALVIALGMLVDNAIVVAEDVQRRVDRGDPGELAAAGAARSLLLPLATATGTTLAAFVPMLMSRGDTADFTLALPVVIMLTLAISYLFAVLVTPGLSSLLLRRRPAAAVRSSLMGRLGARAAGLALRRPGRVLAVAALLVLTSAGMASQVRRQFFPASDRDQLLLTLRLPVGTRLEQTDEAVRRLERALLRRPDVQAVTAFIGSSAPRFYYNVTQVPRAPHVAQLVVRTARLRDVERVLPWVRGFVAEALPQAQAVANRLEQGPPVAAPVEVRLHGATLEELQQASDRVLAALKAIDGTTDVRSTLGLGTPTLRFEVDDAAAARRHLARADVALGLLGRTHGLLAGQYRAGDDPVPIRVRSAQGHRLPAQRLATVDIAAPGGVPVPLAQLARTSVQWRPATIRHRDGRRMVSVLAQLRPGVSYDRVIGALEQQHLQLPAGVTREYGGNAEGSGEANVAILRTMPVGLLLLVFFLLLEFNSFRRLGIILTTVPLAATGVVPGLLLMDQPFGFMSMLGVMALSGIVVNNAIVLLDVVEQERARGASVDRALELAVRRRIRPILLTAGTTIAGMLPLALSDTTLWPPMAWAIISGLLASTGLSLVVVPALYRLLFRSRGQSPAFT
jgi:multidrug efflux pump subunit AcrB